MNELYEYVEARLIAFGQAQTTVPFSVIAVDATIEFLLSHPKLLEGTDE